MARSDGSSAALKGRAGRGSSDVDGYLLGVPSRLMMPRLVFGVTVVVLLCLGLLMIFSASSVTDLTSADYGYDAAYHLKRQLIFIAMGLAVSAFVVAGDYHLFCERLLVPIWVATVVALLITRFAGSTTYGATRWIQIGAFTLQPSEFAKVTIILTAANLLQKYEQDCTIDLNQLALGTLVGVVVPVGLILLQPDKGTTAIIVCTLLCMGLLSGLFSPRAFVLFLLTAIALLAAYSLSDDYSRERIMTMVDPTRDPLDTGYQLMQSFYAFGSGGLLGVGIGNSTQKYSYLPMAHNDMIFAVIGEELGLVGTVFVIALFVALVISGIQIARHAPDLEGRLIAAGSSVLLGVQMLVNTLGVIGFMPLTGKPLPFISYGGSSVIACLLIAAFVLSVSRNSALPETAHDRARRSMVMMDGGDGDVGEATPRSARRQTARTTSAGEGTRRNLTVHEGGNSSGASRSSARSDARATRNANGTTRINLGPSAADRLRGSRRDD